MIILWSTQYETYNCPMHFLPALIITGATRNGEERYELQIRSFFESTLTGSRAWDEPPSGAHQIQYASAEAKEMAEAQMEDLQAGVEVGTLASEEKEDGVIETGAAGIGIAEKGRSLRKFVPKRWRQGNSQTRIQAPQNLVYKPGSTTRELLNSTLQTQYHHTEEELERTIWASLQEASANEESCRIVQLEEEEAINMAKAISLSEESQNRYYEDLQRSAFEHSELSNSHTLIAEGQSSLKKHNS